MPAMPLCMGLALNRPSPAACSIDELAVKVAYSAETASPSRRCVEQSFIAQKPGGRGGGGIERCLVLRG